MGGNLRNVIRRQKRRILSGLTIRLGGIHITLDASWLLLAPASLWVIATIYVPIMGAALSSWQAWTISVVILALMLLSLFLHSLAHVTAARVGGGAPNRISLSILGDPAQSWAAAPGAGKEALIALAGPLAQGLLAALSYFIWDLQLNPFINIISFFLIFFNLGSIAINLIPAFPFDGGRLLRAVIWWLLGLPRLSTRLAFQLGWFIAAGLTVWGIILIAQQSRFSLETGGITLILAALMAISLALRRRWQWDRTEPVIHSRALAIAARSFLAFLILLPLAAITFSIIPMNGGLEAPGFTAPVEPMIQMPQQYRHSSTGSLILTTVIPQSPILAGEWAFAHLNNSIKLEPEDRIVPRSTTAQNLSLENYHMLLNSETVAIVEGLRLAGYTVNINNSGAGIVSILPQSPAAKVLQPGDVITGINGKPINSPAELINQVRLLNPGAIPTLRIERSGKTMEINVPVMKPLQADEPVRIGISVVPYNNGFNLPFPVMIVPQKVDGGPSAGLMFTLGVYDMVTGQDITGGRKIAGTGTIDLEGNVGTIGGVQQKVVAAELAGAQYFLCPPDNYPDALAIATSIKVIKVATAQDAINFLRSLPSLKISHGQLYNFAG